MKGVRTVSWVSKLPFAEGMKHFRKEVVKRQVIERRMAELEHDPGIGAVDDDRLAGRVLVTTVVSRKRTLKQVQTGYVHRKTGHRVEPVDTGSELVQTVIGGIVSGDINKAILTNSDPWKHFG